ncbi:glutamine amidotransferase-related protein [Thalassospira marina]|uniref:GMP synthase n=1 Tax=Thalassospira marina TaxID=2048283 RepID=A0A2N3KW56_9PROT|nr:gamma-glutamyl-gamma-aminobutyrate hydrolase family protein [Thalassospira marina]AUG54810.1 GMP synthase [Thalassospira marina]PKR54811.1 GMP synthase [Thalassospira marina]
MKIGIFETGFVPEEMQDEFKSYPAMFEKMLGSVDPSLEFQSWSVLIDQFPASIHDADAWIITGSKHGVYENLPWMIRLQAMLRDIVAAGIPVFGVCFGHQILAAAMGGTVVKSDKGWGIGVHEYDVAKDAPKWVENAPAAMKLNAFHQDQVVKLPETASVWASSDFCPYAGLNYGDKAASIQPHPEFSRAYENALLQSRRGELIEEDLAVIAEKSLDNPVDGGSFAHWLLAFLKGEQNRQAA